MVMRGSVRRREAITSPGFLNTLCAALEASARQIVEDDVETRAKEILPLRREIFSQRALVLDDAIEAAAQPVLVRHGEVAVQQHLHRRLREPFFVNKKPAARIEQPVGREQLDHLRPRHLAALSAEDQQARPAHKGFSAPADTPHEGEPPDREVKNNRFCPFAAKLGLNEAAFRLQALGRLTEAVEPLQLSLRQLAAAIDWQGSCGTPSNLSHLKMT